MQQYPWNMFNASNNFNCLNNCNYSDSEEMWVTYKIWSVQHNNYLYHQQQHHVFIILKKTLWIQLYPVTEHDPELRVSNFYNNWYMIFVCSRNLGNRKNNLWNIVISYVISVSSEYSILYQQFNIHNYHRIVLKITLTIYVLLCNYKNDIT